MKTIIKTAMLLLMVIATVNVNAQNRADVKKVTYECNFDCPSCEAKVMKNLPYEKGVKSVDVKYGENIVTVEYKANKNSDEGIKQALEKLGYEVSSPSKAHTFNVKGNCGMCKTKIEKAAKSVAGVSVANWDVNAKILTVSFNEEKTNLDAIHAAIAKVGYDTDKIKADDEVYRNLHHCCKYDR